MKKICFSLPLPNNGGVNENKYTFSFLSMDKGNGELHIMTTISSQNINPHILYSREQG
jgi:hypothetical protein